jgi:hypothetical protein
MAFVRWRGNCAELLTTVYENGKSRQLLLANLWTDHASDQIREQVARQHPNIRVDWLAVERTLARGPKAKPAPEPSLTILQAENLLRTIAQELRTDGLMPWASDRLNSAADALTAMRSDPRLAAVCRLAEQPTPRDPSQRTDLSSDDDARPPPPEGGLIAAPSLGPKPRTRAQIQRSEPDSPVVPLVPFCAAGLVPVPLAKRRLSVRHHRASLSTIVGPCLCCPVVAREGRSYA